MKKRKVNLQLNCDLGGKKAGTVLSLETDQAGTIIDRYWRRRLEDAKIDGCVEIVKTQKKSKGEE